MHMKEFLFQKRGIYYRVNEFDANRTTLVFIHGLSGSASAWFPYEKKFGETYNLLTFDLRGHGKSDKPRECEDYKIVNLAEDVYELLNFLDITRCVLVSHSYGSLVALEFLREHVDRVSATIFLSPTAFLMQTRWSPLIRTLGYALVSIFGLFPFHPAIRGRVDYSPYIPTADWDPRRILRDIYATSLRAYLYCLVQAYRYRADELWRGIRVPTRIVHGTADSYIPFAHSVRLSKEISGSKLVLIENANHIIVLNNVLEVSENIETFVA